MAVKSEIFKETYRDSVLLMKIASVIREKEGINSAEVMMGSAPNKDLLAKDNKLFNKKISDATPNDLIIIISAENDEFAEKGFKEAKKMVMEGTIGDDKNIGKSTRTVNSALRILPDANLALISIPGPHVKDEAINFLNKGINLLIFSDNVPEEDEVEIKNLASEKDLLVMGPDCGTAIISNVALAFANKIKKGPVGLVGASGTGLQEVSVLLNNYGLGITHAIGTGSHDVLDKIEGISTIKGLKMLDKDTETKVIAIVSKPPDLKTSKKIVEEAANCSKDVIINFLGSNTDEFDKYDNLHFVSTLEDTALKAVNMCNKKSKKPSQRKEIIDFVESEQNKLNREQTYIRGLFAGGTLTTEACMILSEGIADLYSNISLSGINYLDNPRNSIKNSIIDLGADEFTIGKPHPMIDPSYRGERLIEEYKDPNVAVILMDFVLGYGANEDPAGNTIPYIEKAKEIAAKEERYISFIAYVCGTDEDPQNKQKQIEKLQKHGVHVFTSNAQAARAAKLIVSGRVV